MTTPILAIDASGLVTIVFLLISFVVWLINQMTEKGAAAQKARRPRPPRPPAPQPARQDEDAIDSFLRRAAEGRAPAQRRPEPRPERRPFEQRSPVPLEPVHVGPAPIEMDEPVDVVLGDEHRTSDHFSTIASHVQQYMDSNLDEVDENLDDRLHSVFGAPLGGLDRPPSSEQPAEGQAPVAGQVAAAAGVAAMLSRPENLANAIILQEVLRRPRL